MNHRTLQYRIPLIFILMIIALLPFRAESQGFATVHGIVKDGNTKLPIAYASVGISGKPSGTMTNSNGEFEFTAHLTQPSDLLFVSMLGYGMYQIRFGDIIPSQTLHISLTPVVYEISSVTVTPGSSDGKWIVQRATDSLKNRMPELPFICNAYYREYIRENNTYARAIEAAVNVYNDGQEHLGDRFFPSSIEGIRSSQNYLSRFARTENYNQLSLFLTNNMDIKWFIPNAEKVRYTIDSIVVIDSILVYAISGIPIKTREKTYVRRFYKIDHGTGELRRFKKKISAIVEKGTDRFFQYRFFITYDDYTILKMDYRDTCMVPAINQNVKFSGLYTSFNTTRRRIEFFKYGEKWYPRFLSEYKETGYYKRRDSAMVVNVARYSDMMINNVVTEYVREIPEWKQVKLFTDIYIQGYEFDPIFWSTYNYISDDELRQAVDKELEIARTELYDSTNVGHSDTTLVVNLNHDNPYDTSEVNTDNPMLEELFFRVQIFTSDKALTDNSPLFKGLKGVQKYHHKGLYKYTYGNVQSLTDAMEIQQLLLDLGFNGAFIVPFYKEERISLDEAMEMLEKKE